MRIITTLEQIHTEQAAAIAVGKFDGVHLGHRRLLQEILHAKADGLQAVVFTFSPSPEVLFGLSDGKQLTTQMEKRRILEQLGIDVLIEYPMEPQTAAVDPAVFIEEYLCRRLKARVIAAGSDLSFGAGGKGDFALLDALKHACGYETVKVEKLRLAHREVSSSRVRELVLQGAMEEAEACLGRGYSFTGRVVHGAHLGHTIGIPTVNLIPEADKLLPPKGVYFSEVQAGGGLHRAITNIGNKPTVNDSGTVTIESHLLDFAADIYGQEVTVVLHHFHRPEMRFAGVEALKAQMEKDILAAYRHETDQGVTTSKKNLHTS
ncbi:MAG: bifunctional riboflavin kinase/FAD synthetase [Lachnospiraceae bacterium]|nr:bifunctional riboflavin kinase/FAD synthetase [Lachnospiraceae bacterium]